MTDRLNFYGLGSTAPSDENVHLRGYRAFFPDVNHNSTNAIKPVLTGLTIEAIWVQNNSGGALLPGEIASWDNTSPGEKVDAKAGAAERAAGVVDPYLPAAGVADGRHFWLIRSGPAKVIHAGNDTIGANSELVTAASGRVDLFDATGTAASEPASRFGRSMENPADVAGTLFRALVDFRY